MRYEDSLGYLVLLEQLVEFRCLIPADEVLDETREQVNVLPQNLNSQREKGVNAASSELQSYTVVSVGCVFDSLFVIQQIPRYIDRPCMDTTDRYDTVWPNEFQGSEQSTLMPD